jgi:hypothetical protein
LANSFTKPAPNKSPDTSPATIKTFCILNFC